MSYRESQSGWVWVLATLLFCTSAAATTFPSDANVVDVTAAPYNAVPDDDLDDTSAINQALADHPDGNFIIFLPSGTYDISDRLDWPAAPGGGTGTEQDWRYTVLQGQSRESTIVRLADSTPGYGDPASPRAMLWTGLGAAQRFRNAVRDLTFHTGAGNPGAIGLQFKANNQGGLFNVHVIDGDNSGQIGVDFRYANEIGPLLVNNVIIDGFEIGVDIFFNVNSLTFENLTLRNQRTYGLRNRQQSIAIRGLVSENEVPALYMFNQGSYTTVVDATLTGTGAASNQSAIVYGSGLFVRNVTTPGYANAITFLLNGTTPLAQVTESVVDEFTSAPPLATCDNRPSSLNLSVLSAPSIPWGDVSTDWVNIDSFGASDEVGSGDDTNAIQAALDEGSPTVYVPASGQFPRGYRMDGDVNVPSHVRRVIGTEGRIGGAGRFLVSDDGEPIIFERFQAMAAGVVHSSPRTAVFANTRFIYESVATGAGDVFMHDVVGGPWQFNSQNVWGRQVNTEQDGTNIINNGSDLWILGIKTEKRGTVVETINGGRTEILGGMLYSTSPTTNYPAFVTIDASASIAGIRETHFGSNAYAVPFLETRGDVTATLPAGDAPGGVGGFAAPLYTAYVAAGPNAAPTADAGADQTLVLTATSTATLSAQVNDDGQPNGLCRTPVLWTQTAGPPGATIVNPTQRATDVEFTIAGNYEFLLTADDSELSTSDAVRVFVYDTSLTTASGRGADARVLGPAGNRDGNFGGSESLTAANRPSFFSSKSYLRFDLDTAGRPAAAFAGLDLEIATTNTGLIADWTYAVFGLIETDDYGSDRLDEDWLEGTQNGGVALAGELNFNNAPGNANASVGLDPTTTIRLGDFTLRRGIREVVRLSASTALAELINTDTDGQITLIVVRESSSNNVISFASKENTAGFIAPTLNVAVATDADSDGVPDSIDNCPQVANADQRDTDSDGIGNWCDPDLNNDQVVNFIDLGLLRAVFFSSNEDADFNGDGVVNFVDLGILRAYFFAPPG